MKTMKTKLVLLTVLFCTIGLLSFYGPNFNVMRQPISTTGSNEYRFPINTPTPLTGLNSPSYRFVLYHGDGTFFIGTKDELLAHRHTYSTSASNNSQPYSPIMEVIARYDDGTIPPERSSSPSDLTADPQYGGLVVPSDITINNNNKILLQSTCSAVPGDFITYIVTCDFRGMCSTPSTATGSVTFRYNERVFNFIGMSPAPIYNSTGLVVDALDNPNNTTDPILKKVVYTFSNIPTDRQFNLFFQLQTKNDASLLGLNPMPSAELQVSSTGGCDKFEVNDLITGQTVRSSHDPNYVEIVSNDPCDLSGDIKWRIHFQNEGNAPEDSIWITDWIDPMLDFNNATTPVWSGINGSTLATWKRQGDRTVNWFIDRLKLKGLGQRGVREDETRGYVELITKKSQHFDCSAFVNRARIRFGSKPPIETADAIVSMPCTRDELCSDSCLTILDTAFARRATLLGDLLLNGPMFTTNAVAMLDNASHLKWYPADGLYSAITLNPSLTKNVRRVYTLVASFPGCKRSIIRVPVGPDCNIRFTQKTLLSNGDCNKPNWNLTVNAIGVPATNLMWHNGTTGVSSFLTANHTPQLVYVGVWDTLTGCSAEKWIKLADKCPSSNPRGPWVPIGVVAFMVVIAFFLFKIFSKK